MFTALCTTGCSVNYLMYNVGEETVMIKAKVDFLLATQHAYKQIF